MKNVRIRWSETFQEEVGKWGSETFPHSTLESIGDHLMEEAEEVSAAVYNAPEEGRQTDAVIAEECADVYLLLLHLAYRLGFSLTAEASKKHVKNQQRTWHDDGRGYARHVEEGQA